MQANIPDENAKKNSNEQPGEEGLIDKIKDALQDWSNTDQAQQDFDDTRV